MAFTELMKCKRIYVAYARCIQKKFNVARWQCFSIIVARSAVQTDSVLGCLIVLTSIGSRELVLEVYFAYNTCIATTRTQLHSLHLRMAVSTGCIPYVARRQALLLALLNLCHISLRPRFSALNGIVIRKIRCKYGFKNDRAEAVLGVNCSISELYIISNVSQLSEPNRLCSYCVTRPLKCLCFRLHLAIK